MNQNQLNDATAPRSVDQQQACSALVWSEDVPTITGWYWSQDGDGSERILNLPHCGQWPTHWRQRRAETIANADDDQKAKIAAIPDARWITRWAGPIQRPNSDYPEQNSRYP